MIYAVIALAVAYLGAMGAVLVWLHSEVNDGKALRDMLDKEREEKRVAIGERDVETAAHAVTRDELRKEKNLRADVESQRNRAQLEERENVVEIIQKANIADAAHLVSRILAAPFRVPQAVPEGRATAPGPDSLLDPFVQPPSTP